MAEEDKIKIAVTAEGTAEAAEQLGMVTGALEKQKKTQDGINSTSADIGRKNRIEAIRAEAAQVNNLGAALRAAQQAAVPANDVLGRTAFQFGNVRSSAGAASALVGNLGRSFVTITPQAGAMVGGLQSAGMAMSQILGLVGGGPGIILGGIVAAVGLMATMFAKSAEEADKLAESTKKNGEELKAYLKTISDLKATIGERFSGQAGDAKYEKDFSSGKLSSSQYEIEQQAAKELYEQRHDIQKKLSLAVSESRGDDVIKLLTLKRRAWDAPARGEAARGFQTQAQAREADAAANAAALKGMSGAQEIADADKDVNEAAKTAAAKAAAEGAERMKAYQATQDKIAELMKASRSKEVAIEGMQIQNELQAKLQAIKDISEAQDAAAAEDARRNHIAQAEKDRIAEQNLRNMQERNKAYTDAATNMASIGASTSIKMFSELAKGHKLAIGAVLEGIGDQMVAEGTRVLFQAAAFAFIPGLQVSASGLAGVGAAEIVAGIAMGAAGARSEGGSSYSGGAAASGGGAKATNYADPFGQTARYGNAAGGPTTINVNFPTVLSPSAVDGARIQAAVRQANRVYG